MSSVRLAGGAWGSGPRASRRYPPYCNVELADLDEQLLGLRGIREELPEPTLVEGDPSGLDEEARRRLGIRPLPASLEELERDEVVRSWLSRDLFDCYVVVKRTEISLLQDADPGEICERYLRVY